MWRAASQPSTRDQVKRVKREQPVVVRGHASSRHTFTRDHLPVCGGFDHVPAALEPATLLVRGSRKPPENQLDLLLLT